MTHTKFSIAKVLTALTLGYAFAATWVVYADIVFDNKVPLDDLAFNGLYPISLGIAAIITALIFDRNLKSLGFKKFNPVFLLFPVLIATIVLLIPFGLNLLAGTARANPSPVFDMGLVQIGLPVLIILATGEEIMWRGLLFSEFSKKFNYVKTSLILGLLWAVWHYPVIIHTKYIYGDIPLWFALTAFTIIVTSSSFIYNYLRTKSQSVWLCILLHAFLNYVGFVLVEPLEMTSTSNSVYFKSDIGVFYAAIMILGALWCIKKIKTTTLFL